MKKTPPEPRYTDDTKPDKLAYDDRSPNRNERMRNVPIELDKISDAILAYKAKPKTKAQKKRARKKAKK